MRTHLAILQEPYLSFIICLEKTIESRFSKVKAMPYDRVSIGDKILLKKSGGLVMAEAYVSKVMQFMGLSPIQIKELVEKYKNELKIMPEFLEKKIKSRYITFIWLEKVKRIEQPYEFKKTDQRSWIILDDTNKTKSILTYM